MRVGLVAILMGLTLGCSGAVTDPISHTLNGNTTNGLPISKATPGCTTATQNVFNILLGQAGHPSTAPVILADGSCGVSVMLTPSSNPTNLMAAFKTANPGSFYSYYYVEQTGYPLWIDEPPTVYPPGKDKNGIPLSTVLTADDCNYAQFVVVNSFPAASGKAAPVVSVKTDPKNPTGPRSCYVEAVFQDDPSFLAFLVWNNAAPAGVSGGKNEPWHIYRPINGVVKTIWVHALRALPAT